MKKFLTRVLSTVLIVTCLASCSKEEKKSTFNEQNTTMLEQIPATAVMAGVVNLKELATSAEIGLSSSGITLPAYITNMIPDYNERALSEVNEVLAQSGIDPTVIGVFCMNTDPDDAIAVLRLSNPAKFNNLLDEIDIDDEENISGVNVCSSDDVRFTVRGNYVYLTNSSKYTLAYGVGALSYNDTFASTAAGEYVAKANIAAGVFNVGVYETMLRDEGTPEAILRLVEDSFVGMNCSVSDSKLNVSLAYFDKNGTPINLISVLRNNSIDGVNLGWLDLEGSIDANAARYLLPGTNAAVALTTKGLDWYQLMELVIDMSNLRNEEAMYARAAVEYLENLEGTVMVGVTPKNGLNSLLSLAYCEDNPFLVLNEFDFSVVIETKQGKARPMFNQFKSLLAAQGIPYDVEGESISISLDDYSFYFGALDDMLTISTKPVTGPNDNPVAKAANFSSESVAAIVALPANSQIISQLGMRCGLNGTMGVSLTEIGINASLSTVGSAYPFIKSIVMAVFDIAGNTTRLETIADNVRSQYGRSSSYNYWNDYEDDYSNGWQTPAEAEEYDYYDYDWSI